MATGAADYKLTVKLGSKAVPVTDTDLNFTQDIRQLDTLFRDQAGMYYLPKNYAFTLRFLESKTDDDIDAWESNARLLRSFQDRDRFDLYVARKNMTTGKQTIEWIKLAECGIRNLGITYSSQNAPMATVNCIALDATFNPSGKSISDS